MSFAILAASELPLAEQAAIANRAFASYVAGWAELDAAGLARFLSLQGADLFFSRFVVVNGAPAGFGYINRTGNIPRLAGMALEPAARGTGAAAHLLRHLCDEAKTRGDAAMLLEVIEQNPRAHAFYQREGFRDLGSLRGWRLTSGESGRGETIQIEEVSIFEAMKTPGAVDYPEWPWQITRYAVAKLISARAFRTGAVCIVISTPDDTAPIRIHSFLADSAAWPDQRNALAAIMRHFPGREFFAPAVFPAEFGAEIFAPLGFRREPLSQFLMRRDF